MYKGVIGRRHFVGGPRRRPIHSLSHSLSLPLVRSPEAIRFVRPRPRLIAQATTGGNRSEVS